MIGVCSFYPFGVVIWQDVSNMSCKDGMSPQCVAKVIKNLQLSQFWYHIYMILDKICLNYARNGKQMPYFRKKVVTLRLDKYKSYR